MKISPFILALLAAAAPVGAMAKDMRADMTTVRDKALQDDLAWTVVESLTSEVGARPTGTPAMDRARDWAVAKLRSLGFQNIKVEEFVTPTWIRGPVESAEVVGPWPHKLSVLAIGGSSATPPSGVTAEIALFKSYQDMIDQPVGALAGKIAVVTQPMALLHGYGPAWDMRGVGALEAEKRGAVGYLFRSLSTSDSRLPHTGWGKQAGIPALALAAPDAELLERLAARNQPISVRVVTTATYDKAARAFNISGDIPGTTDEVLLVSAHLDSWDPGTGAEDAAAGIGIVTAAAKVAASVGGKPKRTIRVVYWGASEQDGSSEAYLAAHKNEAAKIIVLGESDSGSEAPYATAVPGGSLGHPIMRDYGALVAPLRVALSTEPSVNDGSDTLGLAEAGVPAFTVTTEAERFMKLHHSADDTLAMVDPKTLAINVAVWATFIHGVSYSDIDFRELKTP